MTHLQIVVFHCICLLSADFKALSVLELLDNSVRLQTISYVSSFASLQKDLAGFI